MTSCRATGQKLNLVALSAPGVKAAKIVANKMVAQSTMVGSIGSCPCP